MSNDESSAATQQKPKYQQREWLLENYTNSDRTLKEVAEMCGVADSTVGNWVRKLGASTRRKSPDISDVDIPEQAPWTDPEVMRTLYVDKQMSTTEISGVFDCSPVTVSEWLRDHNIDVRDRSKALSNSYGNLGFASYYTRRRGRPVWKSGNDEVFVYRLLAVAMYGFEAVCDMEVHHKNEIRWDTRPDNIELLTSEEHQYEHRRIDGIERVRVAEMYENGALSSRKLAEELDVEISSATILSIHKEFYGEPVA